jgi:hypothetical protein
VVLSRQQGEHERDIFNTYPLRPADHCRIPYLAYTVPGLSAVLFRKWRILIGIALYKPLMVVTGSITAAALIIWFFALVKASYTCEAVITGIFWLVVNRALDVVVRVLGMAPADYTTRIGPGYCVIPAMVIASGVIADMAAKGRSPS